MPSKISVNIDFAERRKRKKKKEAFKATIDAVGAGKLEALGLDKKRLDAISELDDPFSALEKSVNLQTSLAGLPEESEIATKIRQAAEASLTGIGQKPEKIVEDTDIAQDEDIGAISIGPSEKATIPMGEDIKVAGKKAFETVSDIAQPTKGKLDQALQETEAITPEAKKIKSLAEADIDGGADITGVQDTAKELDPELFPGGVQITPEKTKIGETTFKFQDYSADIRRELAVEELKADLEVEKTWRKELTKNKKKAYDTFNTVTGLMQQTVSVWKAAAKEKEEFSGGVFQNGISTGLASKMTEPIVSLLELEGFSFTKSYVGQRIETALTMSKLITGGSRVIRSVIGQLLKTLPRDTGIERDMQTLTTQTIRNSFARALGRPLGPEEQKFIDRRIEFILDTPAMEIPGEKPPEQAQYKTFQIDGENVRIPIDKVIEFLQSDIIDNQEVYIID